MWEKIKLDGEQKGSEGEEKFVSRRQSSIPSLKRHENFTKIFFRTTLKLTPLKNAKNGQISSFWIICVRFSYKTWSSSLLALFLGVIHTTRDITTKTFDCKTQNFYISFLFQSSLVFFIHSWTNYVLVWKLLPSLFNFIAYTYAHLCRSGTHVLI